MILCLLESFRATWFNFNNKGSACYGEFSGQELGIFVTTYYAIQMHDKYLSETYVSSIDPLSKKL